MGDQLVSVIIPVFNGEPFIARALDSVLCQDFVGEILVVDDGSSDRTAAAVAAYGHNVTYVQEPHRGVAATRNAGVARVRYPFVAFLDADDAWPAGKLGWQVAHLIAHPNTDVVLGWTQFFRAEGEVARPGLSLVLGCSLSRRTTFQRWGEFDPRLDGREDLDWFMRIRGGGGRYDVVERIALHYHIHGSNMTLGKGLTDRSVLQVFKKALLERRGTALAGT